MYIRRKVFSVLLDEYTGEEKLFSVNETSLVNEEQREFGLLDKLSSKLNDIKSITDKDSLSCKTINKVSKFLKDADPIVEKKKGKLKKKASEYLKKADKSEIVKSLSDKKDAIVKGATNMIDRSKNLINNHKSLAVGVPIIAAASALTAAGIHRHRKNKKNREE